MHHIRLGRREPLVPGLHIHRARAQVAGDATISGCGGAVTCLDHAGGGLPGPDAATASCFNAEYASSLCHTSLRQDVPVFQS